MTKKCMHCGSGDVFHAHPIDRARNRDAPLTMETITNPEAFIFKDRRHAGLEAYICEECGFTMMFISKEGVARLTGKDQLEKDLVNKEVEAAWREEQKARSQNSAPY